MPPRMLFDLSGYDIEKPKWDKSFIMTINPHRFEFEQLDAVVGADGDNILGVRNLRTDEFWLRGHIPGRPLFPGVMMIEASAQLASFYTKVIMGWEGFLGFGGVSDFKFRQEVTAPSQLLILVQKKWDRHRRVGCDTQGIVNGNLVFEGQIVGTRM